MWCHVRWDEQPSDLKMSARGLGLLVASRGGEKSGLAIWESVAQQQSLVLVSWTRGDGAGVI